MSTGAAALIGIGGGSAIGACLAFCVTRFLLRHTGGTMPDPPPLRPGEEIVTLSTGGQATHGDEPGQSTAR